MRRKKLWTMAAATFAVFFTFLIGVIFGTRGIFPSYPVSVLMNHWEQLARPTQPGATLEHEPYWYGKTDFFKNFPSNGSIMMIGDSITDRAEWHEMFPNAAIVNRGIDGDTTTGVRDRLDQILSEQPKAAFIMIGINDFADLGRDLPAVVKNYRAIVARLVEHHIRVFIQSTLPCSEVIPASRNGCVAINRKVQGLNQAMKSMSSDEVTFIDLTPKLAGAHGLKRGLTTDGVHLNGQGYLLWKQIIAPRIG